jgi:hypothetical protein
MLIYLQGKFHPNWLKQMGGIPTKLQKFKIITPTVVICLVAYGPKHKKHVRQDSTVYVMIEIKIWYLKVLDHTGRDWNQRQIQNFHTGGEG